MRELNVRFEKNSQFPVNYDLLIKRDGEWQIVAENVSLQYVQRVIKDEVAALAKLEAN